MKAEYAWAGGSCPGSLSFIHTRPDQMVRAILGSLATTFTPAGEKGVRLSALTPGDAVVGGYRLDTQAGSWFVRVNARLGDPALERALSDWLVSRGAPVNGLLATTAAMMWKGRRFRVDVRPLIVGRHFDGSTADIESIATSLAACHAALADFPWREDIRRRAHEHFKRLERQRENIRAFLEGRSFSVSAIPVDWMDLRRAWLLEMVESYRPDFDTMVNAQCLHGELHQANALIVDGGGAILFDFEESIYVYAPLAWDMAYFIQRFCLYDEPDPTKARERLNGIRHGYARDVDVATALEMMRQIAWHCIAYIQDLFERTGILSPVSELDKFVALERQAAAWQKSGWL